MYKCAAKAVNHHNQASHCHLPCTATSQCNIWSLAYRRAHLFK